MLLVNSRSQLSHAHSLTPLARSLAHSLTLTCTPAHPHRHTHTHTNTHTHTYTCVYIYICTDATYLYIYLYIYIYIYIYICMHACTHVHYTQNVQIKNRSSSLTSRLDCDRGRSKRVPRAARRGAEAAFLLPAGPTGLGVWGLGFRVPQHKLLQPAPLSLLLLATSGWWE